MTFAFSGNSRLDAGAVQGGVRSSLVRNFFALIHFRFDACPVARIVRAALIRDLEAWAHRSLRTLDITPDDEFVNKGIHLVLIKHLDSRLRIRFGRQKREISYRTAAEKLLLRSERVRIPDIGVL